MGRIRRLFRDLFRGKPREIGFSNFHGGLYIADYGDDLNPGTYDQPKQTLAAALDQAIDQMEIEVARRKSNGPSNIDNSP